MLAQLRIPWAFIVRDYRHDVSYKLGFLFRVSSVVLNVAIYYFIANVFSSAAAPYLQPYGGSYFAFVLIGVAFSEYMAIGMGSIGDSIREGQTTGTLELMLLSPTRLVVTLFSSALWSYVYATLRVFVYMLVGIVLGMRIGNPNLLVAIPALLISVVSFNGLGLFAASLIILMKRGDVIGWAVRVSSLVLSGVYYPIGVLPGWLRIIGQALPLTHALEILRRSLLLGEGYAQLWEELLILIGLTVVTLVLGTISCNLAIRIARTDGSLSHY